MMSCWKSIRDASPVRRHLKVKVCIFDLIAYWCASWIDLFLPNVLSVSSIYWLFFFFVVGSGRVRCLPQLPETTPWSTPARPKRKLMRRRSRSRTVITNIIRPTSSRGPAKWPKMWPGRVPTLSERLLDTELVLAGQVAGQPTHPINRGEEEEEPPTVWMFRSRQAVCPGKYTRVSRLIFCVSICPTGIYTIRNSTTYDTEGRCSSESSELIDVVTSMRKSKARTHRMFSSSFFSSFWAVDDTTKMAHPPHEFSTTKQKEKERDGGSGMHEVNDKPSSALALTERLWEAKRICQEPQEAGYSRGHSMTRSCTSPSFTYRACVIQSGHS